VFKKIALALFVAVAMAMIHAFVGSVRPATTAASGAATYTYVVGENTPPVIGSLGLCDLDPTFCPDVAMAANGDQVVITGHGSLSVHPKSVTGGGTFTHKNAAGATLAHGNWTAVGLVSFVPIGQNGTFPAGFTGGVAIMNVVLHPSTGGTIPAMLWVDCFLEAGPKGHGEGVRLNVPGIANFNKHVSGNTVFIKTSP
jgi:hypothetical protein